MTDFKGVTVKDLIDMLKGYNNIDDYIVCVQTPGIENYFSKNNVIIDLTNKELVIDISGDYDE